MSIAHHHNEWLSLVPNSGPFLSLPVLMRVFPQGLPATDPELRKETRLMFEGWEDARQDRAVRNAWFNFVLRSVLLFPQEVIAEGQGIPPGMEARMPEFGEVLRPDVAIIPPKGSSTIKPRLLIQFLDADQDLEKPLRDKHWKASPATRMTELLHAADVPLGLITNGEHWMLVHAPRGEMSGFASWYAPLWFEEPLTFQAFTALLSVQRFFGVDDKDTIEALLNQSAQDQQEVTEQLGWQVRKAVEVLIQSFDKIDQDYGRTLLEGVAEKQMYEAALTVMMRLVFLFSAEERGLLLLGDPLYDQNYAVSTLRDQLQEIADKQVEEILDARFDAWSRLLATFRAVYAGVQHEAMRLPPYGGTLFDPDRFPFLEGRKTGTTWRREAGFGERVPGSEMRDFPAHGLQYAPAEPLKISNRTVLHLLNALQVLQIKMPGSKSGSSHFEARRLSFRSLDIEQIGHVYEGLLDHTAKRATEPVLGLKGSKDKEPEIPLSKLEDRKAKSVAELVEFLKEETGRNEKALQKVLTADSDLAVPAPRSPVHDPVLLAACQQDRDLLNRVLPYAALLRGDTFGFHVVIPTGSVYVTQGSDRRSTGTHYTPRSLTEPIVQHTLEPLVYIGPAEGTPREQWKLKTAREILELKICDMAMGSGAFLVQTCRYMSERLAEAWENAENEMREAGSENRETIYEHSKLSGVGGVAAEHGPGGAVLPGHQIVSQGGTVRIDQPDSAVGQFGASEHSGGSRSELNQGISQSSEHSSGITTRAGDASVAGPAGGTAQCGTNPAAPGTLGTMQPNAVTTPSSLGTEIGLNSLPASRSSVPESQSPVLASRPSLPALFASRSPLPGFVVLPDGSLSVGSASERLLPMDPDERLTIARRFVADRCLYGVDINPMAVEMAKLSLWLITLQRDRPFTFLDHALRCGDSLLGVSSLKQIENFSLRAKEGDVVQDTFATANLFRYVDEATEKRRALENLPSNDHTQIEAKRHLYAEAEAATAKVKALADCLIAFELQGLDGEKYEEQRADEAEKVQLLMKRDADESVGERGARTGIQENPPPTPRISHLASYAREQLRGRRPLHWAVEFPEVFAHGGFDAFVGNPPFIGAKYWQDRLPSGFFLWAQVLLGKKPGKSDVVAVFLRRAFHLLKHDGVAGLLATTTAREGDTLELGLSFVAKEGRLYRALSSKEWPGSAGVYVCIVWFSRSKTNSVSELDGVIVDGIGPSLVASADEHEAYPLQSAPWGFIGSDNGKGEILTLQCTDPWFGMLREDKNPFLRPYLTGDDIATGSYKNPQRWVVDCGDLSFQAVTSTSPMTAKFLQEVVKPVRLATDLDTHPGLIDRWWQLWRPRADQYSSLRLKDRCLAIPVVAKFVSVVELPSSITFTNKICVLEKPAAHQHLVFLSSLFEAWVIKQGGTMGASTITIALIKCIQTFPFPEESSLNANALIAKWNETLEDCVAEYGTGYTAIFNEFHNPRNSTTVAQALRLVRLAIDGSVASAYGLGDLDFGHNFHETKQGVRYTISESARRTVLDRLLALNHQRYEEEVKAGLHDKKRGAGAGKRGPGKQKPGASSNPELPSEHQGDLFG